MMGRGKQIEALEKLIDIGVSRGADTLNTILDSNVIVELPSLEVLSDYDADGRASPLGQEILAVVRMGFVGSLTGDSGLVFTKESALKLIERIAGDDLGTGDFDFLSAGVMTEVGNIVLNAVLGAISNALKLSLNFVVPTFSQCDAAELFQRDMSSTSRMGLLAKTHFVVEDLRAEGSIVLFLETDSYIMLMSAIEARDA